MQNQLGLYIHIPFCDKKCDYCDFVSYPLGEQQQRDYLNALIKEIDLVKEKYSNSTFNTIFIGGGTPTVLFDGFILSLTKKLFSSFNFEKQIEYSIEANPRTLNDTKLEEYLNVGINRISLGVQSLDDDVLRLVGRNQTRADVVCAFEMLKKHNFKNINADVIIGLPNQTQNSIMDTLNFLTSKTTHISVYGLQIEQGTPLHQNIQVGKISPLNEDSVANYFEMATKQLKKAGFIQYEISNFAKPNCECKHNQKYWDGTNYLGLGVSAHSFVNNERFYNTSNFNFYIQKLNSNILPITSTETLTKEQRREEFIMLSLRTLKGLNLNDFTQKFNEDLLKTHFETIQKFIKINLIEIADNYLRIKPDKMYVSNAIILELI